MKHYSFTLTMLLLVLGLGAQTPLQFYFKGQPLADGATVTIEAEADDWGDLACETNPPGSAADGLILKNLTGSDISGTATLTIASNTMATRLVQWCMGGQCVPIPTETYDKDFIVPASGSIMTQLDAFPTQYGELKAEIRVMAQLRTITVNVLFTNADPDAPLTFERRTVVEEYTGTWCGNCPRGIVGLQRLNEQFGNRCITIAVHTGMGSTEPMQISAYPEVMPGNGVPACTVDRGPKLDPYSGSQQRGAYHYGIDLDVAEALAQPAEAGIELVAQWADAQQWDINLTATTTFGFNSDDAPYRLAFVLLEDGLHGTTREWAQVNYFSTAAGYEDSKLYADDDMKAWRDAPYNVTDVTYNHVPVNSLGIKTGIAGSISAPLVKGQAQTHAAQITTLNQKVIQDKSRLSAVVLLLNTTTGRIVNAARADILPYGADLSGIVAVPSASHAAATYDLLGRRLQKAARGLYLQNGKKIIIK